MFNEEVEGLLDNFITEFMEAVRDSRVIFHEGCVVVTAPVGAAPQYITVMVDGINDFNVLWRGVPPVVNVADVVAVWENTVTHRREMFGASGTSGVSFLHRLLSATHSDTVAAAPVRGDVVVANATPAWTKLPIGTAYAYLQSTSQQPRWAAFDWDEAAAAIGADVVHGHFSDAEGGRTIYNLLCLGLCVPTTLTISGGVVTKTQAFHLIDTEGGAASDDLDTINGANDREFLVIAPASGARTIVVKHNTGNLWSLGETDISLDDAEDLLLLFYAPTVGKWIVIGGAGGGLGVHDHSTALLGGIDLNPERLSTRLVVCGPGLPNTTLGAAVARVNALGPPAANSEWVILMMGRTAEAGAVTIPAYCYVVGWEEGAIIGMGANLLTLSSNTGLYNVKVTFSNVGAYVYGNNVSNAWLRNVHVTQSASMGYCFRFAGTSAPRLYDCIAEGNNTFVQGYFFLNTGTPQLYRCQAIFTDTDGMGFYIGDTVVALLEHCIADDTTNISYGIQLAASACTATTRYCVFRAAAAGNDVNTGAGSTWQHLGCHFDRTNVAIGGTETPLSTTDGQAVSTPVRTDAAAGIRPKRLAVGSGTAVPGVDGQALLTNAMGNTFAFVVKNTSGAAVSAGAVGYIDSAGEFKTTTTAYLDAAWCVVLVGGANNADIYVSNRGRVTVTLNGNCSVGDYLYTSTTAGQAQPQNYMRPEMFAIALTANAAGAGGTCVSLLYCHTKFVAKKDAIYLYGVTGAARSDFRAQISAIAGAVVTWNAAGMSGSGNTIDPAAANYHGKVRLYNETDGDYALISDVNVGAQQITLTANAPAGWAVNEWITARSQTCIDPGAPPYYFDLDFSSADNTVVPILARTVYMQVYYQDSTATGGNIRSNLHPWQAYGVGNRVSTFCQVAGTWMTEHVPMTLIQRRLCHWFNASGANTASLFLFLAGWWEAVP